MSKPKYTPGPWEAEEYGRGTWEVWAPRSGNPVFVARSVEGEANVRLIAAAPDLMEALLLMLDQWCAFSLGYDDDGPCPFEAKARAALKKAGVIE